MTNEEKPTLADFLKGKLFSSGLEIAVQQMPYMLRIDLLEQLCEGKKVIHIGFADHKDLIIKKILNNMWLHGRILKRAKECVGIDIDMEAVKFVKENLRIVDVYSWMSKGMSYLHIFDRKSGITYFFPKSLNMLIIL